MSNSLFANLNGSTRDSDDCHTYQSTVTFSGVNIVRTLVGCSFRGGSEIEADPLLGLLTNNGGPTQTEMPSTSSDAINGGPAGGCAGFNGILTVDQSGVKRPIGSACDLGAVERPRTAHRNLKAWRTYFVRVPR